MKRLRQSMRMVLHEPTLFHGYRWLAWGLAALTMAVPQLAREDPAFHIWLWVLLGVFNLLATALAHSYVRIAQMRPAVLGLDVVASVALIWVNGGEALPFLPYAFGALVLPTALFGWRGGLLAAVAFVGFDQLALWMTGQQIAGQSLALVPDLLLRMANPLLFVVGLRLLLSFVRQALARSEPAAPGPAGRPTFPGGERSGSTIGQPRSSRFAPPVPALPRSFEGAVADTPVVAPLAALRASDPTIEEWRRTLIALTPSTTAELPVALDLLAAGFGKRSGIEVRTAVVGRAQTVARTHYLMLLRLAQEALLNVHQHAHANLVVITLRYDLARLTLTVEDDGVGLLDGTYERPGVHALRALAYRLAEVEGSLEVFEGERGGVTLRASVPV